jgi:hypothetical protein
MEGEASMMRPDFAPREIGSEAPEITYARLQHALVLDAKREQSAGQGGSVLFASAGKRGQLSSSSSGTSR